MRRLVLALAVGAVLLAALLVFRATRLGHAQASVETLPVDSAEILADEKKLAALIRHQTISFSEDSNRPEALTALREELTTLYPRVHQVLEREVVAEHSLLYKWTGTRPELPPLILMAHLDVVPVEPDTLSKWEHPPFEGAITDGFIWGRGAIDIKLSVASQLEAVEQLLAQDVKPSRTIYLSYGHDEEVGGHKGAHALAALLASRNVKAELIVDEGGLVTEGIVPKISKPVASIGIAEKGYLSLELSCESAGGHSSMPPKQTTVGCVAAAVQAVESHPFPARMEGPTLQAMERLAPHMGFGAQLAFANLWLLESTVLKILGATAPGNATIRTTTAPTMLSASVKDNVLPARATAVVNFRLLQGDTTESVIRFVQDAVGPNVKVAPWGKSQMNPSPVSPTNNEAFRTLEKTVQQIFPSAIVMPSLVLGATDSRQYTAVTNNIYRFAPNVLNAEDLKRVHSTNERVSVENYRRAVRFYRQLIRNVQPKAESSVALEAK